MVKRCFYKIDDLTNTGRLGIGITQPQAPLQVVGNSNISGDAVFGGDVNVTGTVFSGVEGNITGDVTGTSLVTLMHLT